MKRLICLMLLLLPLIFLSGCGSQNEMKDGFYTAEMSSYSHGWKEYLCIMVKDDTIVYAEFNAKNSSGYIKAWDNDYMADMLAGATTYPKEYSRNFTAQLCESQNSEDLDAVSGATHSSDNFFKLSEAVIAQAVSGDTSIVLVD